MDGLICNYHKDKGLFGPGSLGKCKNCQCTISSNGYKLCENCSNQLKCCYYCGAPANTLEQPQKVTK